MTFSSLEGGCNNGGWVPSTCCSLAGGADCFIFLSLLGERLPRLRCSHSSTRAARFRSASLMYCRSSLVTSMVWVPRLSGVGLLTQVWYMKQNKVLLVFTVMYVTKIKECKMDFWNRELNWIFRSINALICSGKGCYLPFDIHFRDGKMDMKNCGLQYSATRDGFQLRTMWLRPQVFLCITFDVNTKTIYCSNSLLHFKTNCDYCPLQKRFFSRCSRHFSSVQKDYWITDEWKPGDTAST